MISARTKAAILQEIQRVAENGPRSRYINTFTRLHSRFPHQASMPSRQRAVI
jgi:hypothetical protein